MAWRIPQIKGKLAAGAMGKTASAAGGASTAAVQWSKNLSKIKQASWEAGRDMFEHISLINFGEGSQFMRSFTDFFKQMGFFGKIIEPFARLMKLLDAALVQEYSKELAELNEALANEETLEVMRLLAKAFRFMAESNDDLQVALKSWELLYKLFIELGKYLNQLADGITKSQQSMKLLNFEMVEFNDNINELSNSIGGIDFSGGNRGSRGNGGGISLKDIVEGAARSLGGI